MTLHTEHANATDNFSRREDHTGDNPIERPNPSCLLSVVIPIYNESENLPELSRRLLATLSTIGGDFEVILVDDGSRDHSLQLLRELAASNAHFKVVSFSRNFGHQAALYAGMKRSSGRAVVLMDGDLQDPPEVLPDLLKHWREGNDVVYAVRQKRKEGMFRRMAYASFYRILKAVSYIDIPLDSGDFSLMDRRVVEQLCRLPERNKFLRGLRTWVGFRQMSYTYERDARFAGDPKYTLSKLVRLALDGVFSYSYLPLRVAYAFGIVVSIVSFVLAVKYLFERLFSEAFVPQGFTTLAILILFLGGVQLISLGLIGEYVGRVYDEVKRRPEYIEREALGFNRRGT